MNKAFLYLCTLIAIFITLSGFTSARHASQLIFHILFLPITFYLFLATVLQIRNPRKTIAAPLTAYTLTVVGICFLLLVIIAAKMLSIFMMPV